MGTIEQVSRSLFSHQESRPKYWAGICNAGMTATNPTRLFDFVLAGSGLLTIGPFQVPFNALSPPKPVSIDPALRRLINATELRTKIVSWDESGGSSFKLLVNSIINPLTALFRCKNGRVMPNPLGSPPALPYGPQWGNARWKIDI